MCIGIPMRVIDCFPGYALCETHDGVSYRIDTLLLGDQIPGTWLLTFLETAREVISEKHAAQVHAALQAVEMAMQGETHIEHLFQDLIDREPSLPEFLRPATPSSDKGA
ncbi:MAG: HypC/HybG/HupF family hydrogenase formation chaperone [Candidatus Thiodiazotropha sp.]